ncbi:hypothetical protein N8Z86_01650 [Amylibacter sp.]|nr:hypothetical protein [Amylibacter sp.]
MKPAKHVLAREIIHLSGLLYLGAVIESGVMTPISEDYFTNYPDAFMKH